MNKRFVKKENPNKINREIKEQEVRLVGLPEGYQDGVYNIYDAQKIADTLGEDLIEINATSKPVICKIMEYSKYLYNIKIKEKENKKKQSKNETKEIKFEPDIAENDLNVKTKKIAELLEKGNKVMAVVEFRGRNLTYKSKGELILLKVTTNVEAYGIPESLPKMEGKKMIIMLRPKKK
jgi:translation initiation factor IF-3